MKAPSFHLADVGGKEKIYLREERGRGDRRRREVFGERRATHVSGGEGGGRKPQNNRKCGFYCRWLKDHYFVWGLAVWLSSTISYIGLEVVLI